MVQADVCHAYQVLKRGGLKDENIIVFMFDDIAHNPENPRPGEIINRPDGPDVYEGVPKVRGAKVMVLSPLYLVYYLVKALYALVFIPDAPGFRSEMEDIYGALSEFCWAVTDEGC